MARPKQEVAAPEQAETKAERFVLKRSAGFIAGRAHHFFPAGTEFKPDRDGEIIAFLVRAGAIFE